jgi:2-polyprenyl-3-methyl-5-hydroxy-6-metoxy-1,4-benzoquinol methylase
MERSSLDVLWTSGGRGENAIMLAMNGCDVTGIDLAESAISDIKAKAAERHVNVNFVVGDVLRMDLETS